MDFHCLSRRELQALCKRNKIPANVTNVAMADSLKSLESVEGIDELLHMCESATAQSSIESGVRFEVTSPFVPPTGSRSTRRIRAETPVAPRTKMGSLMKDCSQKDPLLTPAPSGATSRRRRAVKEDGSVKQVCPIRRSTRLAEKSARLLKGVADANPDFSKKGLFTDDCHQEIKVNLKESLDDLVEISGVTDVSASTNLEESSEINEEQVDSAEKQDVATEAEPVPTIQVKNSNQSATEDGAESEECSDENVHTEVLERPDEKEVVSIVEDAELVPTIQEKNDQFGTEDEAESEQEEHSFVETKEQGAGSENLDVPGVDAMSTVAENNQQKAHEVVSTVEEVKLVLIVQEEKRNHSESDAKTELKDTNNVEVEKVGCVSEIDADFADVQASETDNDMLNDEDPQSEEITALDVNKAVLNLSSSMHEDSTEKESNPVETEAAVDDDLPPPVNKKNVPTSIRASASNALSTMKERMAVAASDNKENIGSGNKTRTKIVVKATSEAAAIKPDEMGQLSNKFKEVTLTPKLDKDEGGNVVSARHALQVLPDNQKND